MMKNEILAFARITLISAILLSMVPPVSAKARGDIGYQTGFIRWRAAENGFRNWA
jgi:hypothetical protein